MLVVRIVINFDKKLMFIYIFYSFNRYIKGTTKIQLALSCMAQNKFHEKDETTSALKVAGEIDHTPHQLIDNLR